MNPNDVFAQYVGLYKDLSDRYAANIDWEAYVTLGGIRTGIDDLENAWNNLPAEVKNFYQDNKGQFTSGRALWGAEHYRDNGRREGREIPIRTFDGNTVVWDEAQWGADHWSRQGSKEARVLPGPKFSLDENGNLGLAQYEGIGQTIGQGLEKNYNDIVKAFAASKGGNYKGLMEGLSRSLTTEAFRDLTGSGDLNTLSDYYIGTKVDSWDAKNLGAQPLTGGFDYDYYKLKTEGGRKALQEWNLAQSAVNVGGVVFPDADITARFNRDTYLHWYYTTQGKAAGDRGNAAEDAKAAAEYREYLTDSDYQLYRDKVLGLSDRFDNLQDWKEAQKPEVLKAWYESLPSDQKQEYDAGTLPVPTLDNIPDRLKSEMVMDKGATILEGSLSPILGVKEKQQQQMFGALTSDSLKAAAEKLQQIKLQEQQFDFYSGLPGFSEIISLNESISNSILGDSGVGGVLSWTTDPERAKESLEASLEKVTGVPSRSNAVYNWQKWFDEQLTTRYKEGAVFTDQLDPNVTYTLDADFAKDYVDRYLKPRFDTSRSMSEFISYMDVKQNEQNIFQTQSALDSLRDIADIRAKAYLDGIKNKDPLNFNTEFYFNPGGNFTEDDPKNQRYLKQKEEVAADWETAKTQGNTAKVPGTEWTWNQWAYYYGLDPTNQDQFAKLHYQVKGAANGFDPAKDLITLKDAEEYIQGSIIPEITNEKLNIGDITFMNFVTPEEYADKMLEGISPESHREEWDKLLETLGLSGKQMGIEEIKQYIVDAFRTGAAKEIRESIKYLNEKRLQPSQERLGVAYIERPEDYTPTDSPNQTELYRIFKDAGYQGNEDEFYSSFMTDIDRGEMELLTQGQKGLTLGGAYSGLTSKDPFEALASIEGLLSSDKTITTTEEDDKSAPSYFKIFEDEEEDTDYKSTSGQKILGEFTSFFKGFS